MDWREMAGRPTVRGLWGDDRRGWAVFRGAYSGGRKVGEGVMYGGRSSAMIGWDGRMDPSRGWVIAFCWIAACACECVFSNSFYLLYTPTDLRLYITKYLLCLPSRPQTTSNPRLLTYTCLQPYRSNDILL